MLIKWEGGNPQSGFPTITTKTLTTAAILVNILSVISSSLAVPSSVPPPTVLLAKSIGISGASQTPTMPLTTIPASMVSSSGRRVPKQVGHPTGSSVASNTDHQPSETHNHGFMGDHGHGHHHHGHHHHHHGDGKYFTYAHNPGYDEYEYGYRRGNDYHFQERYEKYGPYWNFKTKVKWGDKYAGYGEHYWDYNHAGSGHDDGHGHGHGHYSEPVPTYENQPGASNNDQKRIAMIHKRQSEAESTKKNKSKSKASSRNSSKRIPVRKEEKQSEASPQEMMMPPVSYDVADSKPAETREGPVLVLDRKTGQIIDTETGRAYWLKPENSQYY